MISKSKILIISCLLIIMGYILVVRESWSNLTRGIFKINPSITAGIGTLIIFLGTSMFILIADINYWVKIISISAIVLFTIIVVLIII